MKIGLCRSWDCSWCWSGYQQMLGFSWKQNVHPYPNTPFKQLSWNYIAKGCNGFWSGPPLTGACGLWERSYFSSFMFSWHSQFVVSSVNLIMSYKVEFSVCSQAWCKKTDVDIMMTAHCGVNSLKLIEDNYLPYMVWYSYWSMEILLSLYYGIRRF